MATVIVALAAGGACGSPVPCGLRVCDVREPQCQQLVAASAACLRPGPPIAVPVNVIPRDVYIRQRTAAMVTPEEDAAFRGWNSGLALFGLAPWNLAPSQAASVSARWVGAFYSSTDKAITIVDGGWSMASTGAVALLVHEYVHALQDASVDLIGFYEKHGTDLDRRMGLGAVIEGEATYIGDRAAIGLFGDVPADVPWDQVFRTWQKQARSEARSADLPVTLAPLHFRYPFGTDFIHDAISADGWAATSELFANPPSGAREGLAGFRAREPSGGPWAEDLGLDAVPILPARFSFQQADRMGAWIVGVYFGRARFFFAAEAEAGLRGDVLSVYRDDVAGGAVAVWRLRFSTAALAETVAAEVDLGPNGRVRQLDRDVILVAAADVSGLDEIPLDLTFQPLPVTSAALAGSPGAAGTIVCAAHVGDSIF